MVRLLKEFKQDTREMREAYCAALIAAAEADPRVFALDCDLVSSVGTGAYVKRFPDRHLNCGIQEANACGVAAGMSSRGFVPFLHSFGVFASRRIMDQIYISCAYAGLNVKVVGADPGVTAAVNGGTHMALEDAGALRVIPKMTIVEPSDSVMMEDLVKRLAKHEGVDYLRMARKKGIRLYEEGSEFPLGKAAWLREGTDVAIIASGVMVYEALRAADMLAEEGISATVIDMYTIKPLDIESVVRAAETTGAVVAAENHNVIGALGSAVAEALSENCPVPLERVGVMDRFGEVGPQEYLMDIFHLTAGDIVEKAKRAIERKR